MKTEKKSAHTPGPVYKRITCQRQEPDCCFPIWDKSNNLKDIGLCSLHAAAPDLLEAAKEVLDYCGSCKMNACFNPTHGSLKSAIAKAKGK